jgi:hypothetical protein
VSHASPNRAGRCFPQLAYPFIHASSHFLRELNLNLLSCLMYYAHSLVAHLTVPQPHNLHCSSTYVRSADAGSANSGHALPCCSEQRHFRFFAFNRLNSVLVHSANLIEKNSTPSSRRDCNAGPLRGRRAHDYCTTSRTFGLCTAGRSLRP